MITDKTRFYKSTEVYDDGMLRVEHGNYSVFWYGRFIRLTRTEFLIVSEMAENPRKIVSTRQLQQRLWNGRKPLNVQTIRVYISNLRSKLAPFGVRIKFAAGTGYRLISGNDSDQANNKVTNLIF